MQSEKTTMKEIKAYLRCHFVDGIVKQLEQAGAKNLTVIRVVALGAQADTDTGTASGREGHANVEPSTGCRKSMNV